MKKKIVLFTLLFSIMTSITGCQSPFGPSKEELAAQAAEQARLEEEARLAEEERLKQERLDKITSEQEQKDFLTERYSSITGHDMSTEIEWESKLASEQLDSTEIVEESTETAEYTEVAIDSMPVDIPMGNCTDFYNACSTYGDITAVQYDIVEDNMVVQILCGDKIAGSSIVTIIGTCTPITTECTNELSAQLIQQVNVDYNADTFKALDYLATLADVSQDDVSICSHQGVSISATGAEALTLVVDEYRLDVKSATVESSNTSQDGEYVLVRHTGTTVNSAHKRKEL